MSAESLGAGFLNASEVNLLVVPRHGKIQFTSLYLFNRDNLQHRFNINCTIGANKVSLGTGLLLAGESAEVFDVPKTLKPGEKLSAYADISNQISYILIGEQLPL